MTMHYSYTYTRVTASYQMMNESKILGHYQINIIGMLITKSNDIYSCLLYIAIAI